MIIVSYKILRMLKANFRGTFDSLFDENLWEIKIYLSDAIRRMEKCRPESNLSSSHSAAFSYSKVLQEVDEKSRI